jgi:hypothetical protein
MTTDDPLLDRAAIETAFTRLGERLAARGVVADLYVIGGLNSVDEVWRFAQRCSRTRRFQDGRGSFWRTVSTPHNSVGDDQIAPML